MVENCKKKISIMQPGYFPWPGFFDLIYRVDQFVVYDSVRYTKATWRNRNRIRVPHGDGWAWLTVPVEKDAEHKLIKDVKVANNSWQKKHHNLITQSYSKAPHYEPTMAVLEKVFFSEWSWLVDLDLYIQKILLDILGGCGAEIIRSSELDLRVEHGKTDKLLELCQVLGADYLYDSMGARVFFDERLFASSGIRVVFQDFKPPVYEQVFEPFIPGLSVLDLIMNCGPSSLEVLLGDYYAAYARTE